MAVTVTSTISGPYIPNGATTVFAFDFKAGSADEIQVYRDLGLAEGWELVPGADYTASVDPDQEGGDVEFSVAPAIGTGDLYIVSEPLFTREGQYTGEGPFTPKGLNNQFDRAAVRDLALARDLARSIKVPLGEEPTILPRVVDRALKYLAFDADGNPVPAIAVVDLVLNEALGVSPGSSDMGATGGSVLPDGGSAKEWFAILEGAVEAFGSDASGEGASLVGLEGGGSVQAAVDDFGIALKYVRSSPYEIKIGYDSVSDTTAAVKIGANTAFAGHGVLMIGGAGKKDGGNGVYVGGLGHPNWPAMLPSLPRNPMELALYGGQTTGVGTSSGGTTFTSTSGVFMPADVGRAIWLNGSSYTISSYTDPTHVVLNAAAPAGTYVWHIVKTTGSGTCTVTGGVVTRITGDPFIPHTFGTGFTFKLNGAAYAVTAFGGPDQYTIAAPPVNGTYPYTYETNINDQIAAFRLGPQFPGLDEENVTLMARTMRYELRTLYAGAGAYRDFVIGSGEYAPGALAEQITCHADGAMTLQKLGSKTVRLGGTIAADRMFNISRSAGHFGGIRLETNSVQRWDISVGDGAESGSNAGSDLVLNRFSDAGVA